MNCFMNTERYCNEHCAAYVDSNPPCMLLSLGYRFVHVLEQVQDKPTKTKHPRSAPPPEVK